MFRQYSLFALLALVSLAGFFAGWAFRDGLTVRAVAATGLVLVLALVAGALASPTPEEARLRDRR